MKITLPPTRTFFVVAAGAQEPSRYPEEGRLSGRLSGSFAFCVNIPAHLAQRAAAEASKCGQTIEEWIADLVQSQFEST